MRLPEISLISYRYTMVVPSIRKLADFFQIFSLPLKDSNQDIRHIFESSDFKWQTYFTLRDMHVLINIKCGRKVKFQ